MEDSKDRTSQREIKFRVGDFTKAKEILNFTATTTLDEGIKDLMKHDIRETW